MRDDIHRGLPLPPAWKRVVKACSRDAEAKIRSLSFMVAAEQELARIRPAFLASVQDGLTESMDSLFPGSTFKSRIHARNVVEADVERECAALVQDRTSPNLILQRAMVGAILRRQEAVVREVRAKLAIRSPADCREVLSRLQRTAESSDLTQVVSRQLAGSSGDHEKELALDLDEDLR